ncbi:MAG: L,D-transpeptidase, partial [Solirubrobacterales bacterium]
APAARAAGPLNHTLEGLNGKKAQVQERVVVKGQVTPANPGVPVTVTVAIPGEKPDVNQLSTNASGAFSLPIGVLSCCRYKITAQSNGISQTVSFGVQVPHGLHSGSKGPKVALFHNLLREQGYFVRGKKRYSSSTGIAVLAFRKVNKMARSEKYSAKIYKKLLQGRGAFPLQHQDPAKHVETDLSRQVLVLAQDGKPKYTFPISSGAGGTPTVTGTFHFYSKTPGYNAKRMFYSAYFIGGYATHGYNPVPNYPASHGCLRNPIPDAIFIYNWINLGDTIYVYH